MNEGNTGRVAGIRFLTEQDGPSERAMKERLTSVLRADAAVVSADLVRAQLSQGAVTEVSVALAIRRTQGQSLPLSHGVQSTFAALFAKAAHLDIVFVTPEKEREAAAVAKALYRRST